MTAHFDPNKITFFAKTDARGQNVPFGIKAIDRQKHMYVIGKTGMGKSTLLENMAVQDMRNGEGMAFIDPHGATAETLLDYIPEERKNDVLYFAPFDMEYPVSFNVMEDVGPDKRHLVVSGLMSVFEKIWVDAWSARMAYILQNTLMALLEYPDSTLLGVNRMLSDKNYRKKVVDNISDPSVRSFWVDEFAKYNERYMQEAGDAIKNKIGQFTANPVIRNIIGQPKSSFDLRKIMDEQKILIMNLSKGLVGESNANLLGSMLTTRIYLAAMSRADMSQETLRQMPNFYFYVDEFQSFANATFADILSEARKYKLNLTIAHQYIEQMEEEVRNAVFGNVGTIAAFRVGPFDAEVLEAIFQPQFYAVDICNLGFAQIYLTLMIDGVGSPPFSAQTMPPLEKPRMSCRDMVIHSSRMNYARPRGEVEEEILAWHGQTADANTGGGAGKDSAHKSGPPRQEKAERPHKTGGGNSTNSTQHKNNGRTGPPQENQKPRNDTSEHDRGGHRQHDAHDRRKDDTQKPKDTSERKENRHDQNIEALRSVLAGISQKTESRSTPPPREQKEGQRSEKPERPQARKDTDEKRTKSDKPVPRTDESRAKKKPERDRDEKNPHKEVSLKEALADVLKQQGTVSSPQEKKPATDHSSTNEKQDADRGVTRPQQMETQRKDEEKRSLPKQPEPSDAPRESRSQEREAASTAQEPVPERAADQNDPERSQHAATHDIPQQPSPRSKPKDPLDPKLLERMMKVRSDDKTPLK